MAQRWFPHLTFRSFSTASIQSAASHSYKSKPPKTNLTYAGLAVAGVSLWAAAFGIAFNYQKMATSIFKESIFLVRESKEAQQWFGNNIRHPGPFSWIRGPLNQVKGIIDIRFKVYGDKDNGYVHMKAIKDLGSNDWKILHFVIEDKKGQKLFLETN